MTQLYIIRHAQSQGNDEGRFQGQTDRPLSALGHKQADLLAERCRGIEAVHVYSSPLSRARMTADAANRYLNLPLTEMPELMEINVGKWENLMFAEIEEIWPEERRIWHEQHHLFNAPGGETMRDVYNRMTGALLSIAEKHRDEAVIVVSHGCAIRNVCAWVMGGIEQNNAQDWLENTSVTRIDIDENGEPTLVFRNDYSHLPPQEIDID